MSDQEKEGNALMEEVWRGLKESYLGVSSVEDSTKTTGDEGINQSAELANESVQKPVAVSKENIVMISRSTQFEEEVNEERCGKVVRKPMSNKEIPTESGLFTICFDPHDKETWHSLVIDEMEAYLFMKPTDNAILDLPRDGNDDELFNIFMKSVILSFPEDLRQGAIATLFYRLKQAEELLRYT